MRNLISLLFYLFLLNGLNAQITNDIAEPIWNLKGVEKASTKLINIYKPDLSQLLREDSVESLEKHTPLRFGVALDTLIDVKELGKVSQYGQMLRYEIDIHSEGAKSLNLNFSSFYLPQGSLGYIKAIGRKDMIGALSSNNNKLDREFSTRPLLGEHLRLYFYVPFEKRDSLELEISQIVYGYKDIFQKGRKTFNSSGYCNRNTNCPEAAIWQDVRRSVVLILASNNTRLCTGTLVNNVKQDSTPYLLTASHCNLATNSIFVFGYENSSPNCLTNADGNLANSISGAFARSENSFSDFKLFELSSRPPISYNPYYAGWDASGIQPLESTVIHHPSGDIKKISQDYDTAKSSAYSPPNTNTHWQVGNWESGTTEQGSSGSALFDQFKRVVGQLEGGSASCNQNLEDYFGKFSVSWSQNSATNRQLKYWLDPDTTNTLVLDGMDPLAKINNTNIELTYVSNVPSFGCDSILAPEVHFMNVGNDSLTAVRIQYGTNFQYTNTINWTGTLYTDALASQVLPSFQPNTADTVFNVRISTTPLDQDTSNNIWSKAIRANTNPLSADLTFNTDEYGNELSWDIKDTANAQVLHKGGPYVLAPDTSGLTYRYNLCLYEGCFDYTIYDAYGDGFTGPFSGRGYALITGPYGDTLLYEANFTGSQKTIRFCVNDTTTSLRELKKNSKLLIYPNPIAIGEYLNIDQDQSKIASISIFDLNGRMISEQKGMKLRIPNRIDAGLYLIQLNYSNGDAKREKLIVR